jgi:hypothetical protein
MLVDKLGSFGLRSSILLTFDLYKTILFQCTVPGITIAVETQGVEWMFFDYFW